VGGLNIYANASQVADNESPDLQNIEFTGISAIKKRRGYVSVADPPVASHKNQGQFTYITSSVTETLCVSNGILFRKNGTSWDTITGGTLSTTANVNACQVGDRLYLVDGTTVLQYYNGTNIVTTGITAAPTKVCQTIYYNKRIYCNSADNKDRVYYGGPLTSTGASTNTGDFTVDTDGGYFGFGSGMEVIGFAKLSNSLYVFLRNCIYKLQPTYSTDATPVLDHAATQISNSVGCRAPRSIDNVENDVFFVDSTVYSLGEVATYATIRTKNISGKISNILATMNQVNIANVAGIYYNKEQLYLLSLQDTGTYINTVIGYSVGYQAWTKWTNVPANSWLDFTDSTGIKHLYFGSDNPADGGVYEMFVGITDDGTAISSYYKTKQFSFDAFHITKVFQDWNIDFGNVAGPVTVYVYVDNALSDTATFNAGDIKATAGFGTSPFGTYPFGVEGNFVEVTTTGTNQSNTWRWHRLDSAPRGTTFQLMFESNGLNDTFEIKQASVAFIELPYRAKASANEI
jgi:hypothetical protein